MQVLIADDSPVSRRIVGSQVAQWGYQTIVVHNGAEAWEILASPESPRLAILDWQMPGIDGTDLCRRLRARDQQQYTYAILMTSCDLPSSLVEGLRAGADDFVRKPFDPAELEARLRTGRRIIELQDRLLATQETLRIQATRDSLTGLWNRAEILKTLDHEWERRERQKSTVGVLMVDVDGFKQINDRYGHPAGDEVLRIMGRILPQAVRSYDQIGRVGGEEFLVVLPNASLKNICGIGERMRYRVERQPVRFENQAIPVTISLGASSTSENLDSAIDLIRRADQALYAAKRGGRNRVCTAADVLVADAKANAAVPAGV
jgi:diguanylate cyclase (GGDEF)-like protein